MRPFTCFENGKDTDVGGFQEEFLGGSYARGCPCPACWSSSPSIQKAPLCLRNLGDFVACRDSALEPRLSEAGNDNAP
jgi:hypothetical protein